MQLRSSSQSSRSQSEEHYTPDTVHIMTNGRERIPRLLCQTIKVCMSFGNDQRIYLLWFVYLLICQ